MNLQEDRGIIIFIGVSIVLLVLFFLVGALVARKQRNSTVARWGELEQTSMVGEQPFLTTQPLDLGVAKRQWELFQNQYPIGTIFSATIANPEGGAEHAVDFQVSRVGRGLSEGWPNPKITFMLYFATYENAEFPFSSRIKGSQGSRQFVADAVGVRILDKDQSLVWECPWSEVEFKNVQELMLYRAGVPGAIMLDHSEYSSDVEELVIKYGKLRGWSK